MGSTNKTTNIELSQFLGSDSPKWLTDYNGDMQKIDTFAGAIQAQADATALVVGSHTASIETLQNESSDYNTAIQQLRTDVDGNTGSINTINSLIGNGEPTTTDKTLIGAINELHSDLISTDSKTDALSVYKIYHTSQSVEVLTTDTIADVATKVFAAINIQLAGLSNDEFLVIDAITAGNYRFKPERLYRYNNADTANVFSGSLVIETATKLTFGTINFSSSSRISLTDITFPSTVSGANYDDTTLLSTLGISSVSVGYQVLKTL